jgi:hypothetical protein
MGGSCKRHFPEWSWVCSKCNPPNEFEEPVGTYHDPLTCKDPVNCPGCVNVKILPELDMINSPPHYTNHPSGVECITIIRECPRANIYAAMKYLWRFCWAKGPKDTPEQKFRDLQKAIWHLTNEMEGMEK